MKIIVVGEGKIGYLLVQQLSREGHDVVVVDRDISRLHYSQEKLDVAIVCGNGASIDTLKEAGAEKADLLIAVTSSDEVNLLTAMVARKLGCPHTAARIRNQEYDREMNLLKSAFGLSMTINPEKMAGREVFRLLQFPSFLTRSSFAGGRAEMVEIKVSEGDVLAGRMLMQTADIFDHRALICSAERDGVVTIPSGSFTIQPGDKLSLAIATADLPFLLKKLGMKTKNIRRVMIIGGGAPSQYLAESLIGSGVQVTIVERDHAKCEQLCELLPRADIVEGDASMQSVLLDEGITEADAVITLTGLDEQNIMISLFAHSVGVQKTITKVNRVEYLNVLQGSRLDTIVSPKLLTANEITRYVRAVSQSRDGSVETLYTIGGGKVEALGFTVPDSGSFLNVPFAELKLKEGILIASIVRNQHVIIPSGQSMLISGDSIIVIASADRAVSNLKDIFADSGV